MPATSAASQTVLARLAGVLGFLCLVLFLLAVEQRHTVAAWRALSAGAARLAVRVTEGEAAPPPLAAAVPTDAALTGRFAPADEETRTATGAVAFAAARLIFDSGETLHTRPLRIARADEAFAARQTWSARLAAPPEAQIELREVSASTADRLCGGVPVKVVALLHRGPDVQLMLFRARPESDASSDIVCGLWSYTVR